MYQEAGAASDAEVAESLPGTTSEVDIPVSSKSNIRSKLTNSTRREEDHEQVAKKELEKKPVMSRKASRMDKINNDEEAI